MPTTLLPAWLGVSLLYMLSAIYFKVRYDGRISWYYTGSLFSVGGALLLAVNRYWLFYGVFTRTEIEVAALTLLFVGWVLAVLEIRRRARLG